MIHVVGYRFHDIITTEMIIAIVKTFETEGEGGGGGWGGGILLPIYILFIELIQHTQNTTFSS